MPLTTITEYLKSWSMTCQRPAKRATKQNAAAVKEFQLVTFPKIVAKAKKEHGIIFLGDETGICNQENYQRGFSPCCACSEIARQERKNQYDLRNKSKASLQIYVLLRHFDVATAD